MEQVVTYYGKLNAFLEEVTKSKNHEEQIQIAKEFFKCIADENKDTKYIVYVDHVEDSSMDLFPDPESKRTIDYIIDEYFISDERGMYFIQTEYSVKTRTTYPRVLSVEEYLLTKLRDDAFFSLECIPNLLKRVIDYIFERPENEEDDN